MTIGDPLERCRYCGFLVPRSARCKNTYFVDDCDHYVEAQEDDVEVNGETSTGRDK